MKWVLCDLQVCEQRKEKNHAQCHFLKHTLKRMLRAACYSKSTHIEKQDHTALGETLFSMKKTRHT